MFLRGQGRRQRDKLTPRWRYSFGTTFSISYFVSVLGLSANGGTINFVQGRDSALSQLKHHC